MTDRVGQADARRAAGNTTPALHLFALSALAIAQPLLDLLARGATFLVEHDLGRAELVALVFGLLLVPLPAVVLVAGLRRVAPRLARGVHLAAIVFLVGLFALQPLGRWLDTGWPVVFGALVAGLAFALAYARRATVRQFTSILALALVAVPAAFFAAPQVRSLMRGFSAQAVQVRGGGEARPVVVVILDELALSSLLDDSGEIDADRFPNFAALRRSSTWFRNAVAAADRTEYALPAMLTGRLPERRQLPTAGEFPQSIFTALAGSHRIVALEALTRLCPAEFNEYDPLVAPAAARRGRLLADLSVLYRHLVYPRPWRASLPDIGTAWGGFTEQTSVAAPVAASSEQDLPPGTDLFKVTLEALGRDRAAEVRSWIAQIVPGSRPGLYFLHALLPHFPWEYLRDGRTYPVTGGSVPGLGKTHWEDDPDLVALARERYLLQVEFVDTLLGELLGRLDAAGLGAAGLIVVADHGSSFLPGDSRRSYTPTNAGDVLPIPLFVREPGQQAARVVDEPVSALQVAATVFDLAGVEPPWTSAERSVLAGPANLPRKVMVEALEVIDVPAGIENEMMALRQRQQEAWREARGDAAGLLGRPVDELGAIPELRVEGLRLDVAATLRDHDPAGPIVPIYVDGSLGDLDDQGGRLDVAVAIDGVIRATTRPYRIPAGDLRFATLVPPEVLHAGAHDVQLFAVEPGAPPRLQRLTTTDEGHLRLVRRESDGREEIVGPLGSTLVVGSPFEGYFGVAREGERVHVNGWVWDRHADRTARDVVLFFRGEAVATVSITDLRGGGLPARLGKKEPVRAGFATLLPARVVDGIERHGLRVVARSETGVAVELRAVYKLLDAPAGAEAPPVIEVSDGRRIPVVPGLVQGGIGRLAPVAEGWADVEVRGWAADPTAPATAVRILAFDGERCIYLGGTGEARPGSAAAPNPPELRRSGFTLRLRDPELERAALRVIAVTADGRASELLLNEAAAPVAEAKAPKASQRGAKPRVARRGG